MATEFRGLKHFIEEVKLCPDAALEKKRVDSELSKIRGKFAAAAPLSSYAGKKYIWKLVYASVLGYDVDFGHAEAVGLMASADAAEKAVGYLAVSVLAASKTEGKWRRLFSATVANDCASGNAHAVALALAAAANGCSGVDQAQVLRACVATARKLVVDAKSPADVVRRAALLVSRFEAMRSAERAAKRPPDAPTDFVDAADRARWAAAVGRMLERETTTLNLPPPPPPSPRRGFLMMSSKGPSKNVAPPPAVRWGVLLSLVTMISAAPDDADDSLVQSSMAPCAKLLSAIERTKSAGRGSFDHEYHGVCAPWLRAKLLRVLSRRRITALDGGKDIFLDDGDFVKSVFGYYQGLIDDLAVGNNGALRLRDPLDAARRDQNKAGVGLSLLLEYLRFILISVPTKAGDAAKCLAGLAAAPSATTRAAALHWLADVVRTPSALAAFRHIQTQNVELALNDTDAGVRRTALSVVSALARAPDRASGAPRLLAGVLSIHSQDESFAIQLCDAICDAKHAAPTIDASKAPDLQERSEADDTFVIIAVSQILPLPATNRRLWHRVASAVLAMPANAQRNAARRLFDALAEAPKRAVRTDGLASVASLVFADHAPPEQASAYVQRLHKHWPRVCDETRAAMLSCYAKVGARVSAVEPLSLRIFEGHLRDANCEVATRSCEYRALLLQASGKPVPPPPHRRRRNTARRRPKARLVVDFLSGPNPGDFKDDLPSAPNDRNPFDVFDEIAAASNPYAAFDGGDDDDAPTPTTPRAVPQTPTSAPAKSPFDAFEEGFIDETPLLPGERDDLQ